MICVFQYLSMDSSPQPQSFHQDISNKVQFLTSLVLWIVGCMVILPISLPGIIISLQYSTDECVKGSTKINIALDVWLCISCAGMIISTVIILLLLCINPKTRILKGFGICISIIYGMWTIVGWYLLINSTLECDHDSLWVMSTVFLSVLSTAIVCGLIWIFSVYIRQRCRCCECWNTCIMKCLDLNEIEQYANL